MFKRTVLKKFQKSRANLPARRVAKARRLSFMFSLGYFLLLSLSILMISYGYGIPGRAW